MQESELLEALVDLLLRHVIGQDLLHRTVLVSLQIRGSVDTRKSNQILTNLVVSYDIDLLHNRGLFIGKGLSHPIRFDVTILKSLHSCVPAFDISLEKLADELSGRVFDDHPFKAGELQSFC